MLIFEKDIKASLDELYYFMSDFSSKINDDYIYNLFCKAKNEIVLYSFDNNLEPDIKNCPCGLIYNVDYKDNEMNIYIMFIATKYKFRNLGYASIFIEEFINYINDKYVTECNNNIKYNKINIVLDSIMEAVTFYEHIGFKWVRTHKYNEIFNIFEDNCDYEHFIMVYELL
jgi:ribosomal protein S18 acetylase RimI-like enzyme